MDCLNTRTRDDSQRSPGPAGEPLGPGATDAISAALNALLADVFTLYVKTKNFHWHISGPHFRDFHLLLDEQASQILPIVDLAAERVRKMGGTTLRSIGQISRHQRLRDNDNDGMAAADMLRELHQDNVRIARFMRDTHAICDGYGDVASASLLENWIDEAEQRIWFLHEVNRPAL